MGMEGIDIVSRAEWGARNGRPLHFVPDDEWNGIEVHHTATPTAVDADLGNAVRQVQNFHLDNQGWRDIFYGYLVHPDGRIVHGRGRHLSTSANNTHLTVCFLGNFETQQPTAAAINSFRRFRQAFLRLAPQATSLTYHGQRAATACCGANLIAHYASGSLALPPIPNIPNHTGEETVELEQYRTQLTEHRTQCRKIAAAIPRQAELVAAMSETMAAQAASMATVAEALGRQSERAQRELDRVDSLLGMLEAS